jgi:hypothetical protein
MHANTGTTAMIFTTARAELTELVQLTSKIATFDATLAARRDVEPEQTALERRLAWERRQIELLRKYELTSATS